MNWEKTKEKILDQIVPVVVSLIASLFLVIWQAVPSETWERVEAAIPKRVLLASIALLLIGFSAAAAYIASLRWQLKKSQFTSPELPKRYAHCNVLWDEQANPRCTVCDVHLVLSPRESYGHLCDFLTCPKCKGEYQLLDSTSYPMTFDEVRRQVSNKLSEIPPVKQEDFL
jgi:hypothetical protein